MASLVSRFKDLWNRFWNETGFYIQYIPYSTQPVAMTEAAADVNTGIVKEDFPEPPSFLVSDDINAMLAPYQQLLVKTRLGRMKSHFKALLQGWFTEYAETYCPEDTHHLISSYTENFRNALSSDMILIESDLWYAGLVEDMSGVNWQKGSAIDQFAQHANDEVKRLIPTFLQESYRFALT